MSLRMAPSAVSLVDSGEEISITSNFRESTTQLQYDILIDGILRMSKVHSGTTIRALRKVDNFSQFYTKPDSAMFQNQTSSTRYRISKSQQRDSGYDRSEDLSFTPRR